MATGSIDFTVSETAGVTRAAGGTLASPRFPFAIPLRADEAKLNTNQFRVIDTSTNQPLTQVAFRMAELPLGHASGGCVGGARWGDYGNTGHRGAVCLVDFLPTVGANETRTYQLQTSGGSGSTAGGITVGTSNPDYYEINTGAITARVPRRGAMSVLEFLRENSTGFAAINGDGGGLWMQGIAGSPPSPGTGPANNQAGDYVSNLDISGDGASNGGDPLEIARPTKYFTSIEFANSQRVRIKIDTIRCVGATGEFKGMNRDHQGSASAVPTPRAATWDVYLEFFRNSGAIRRQFIFKSTGGGEPLANGGEASDCAVQGYGVDTVTTFTGSMTAHTRDETGATKVMSVTSATAKTLRQLQAPTSSTYGMSLQRTGDFTPTGTPITMLEAFYAVSNGTVTLLEIPFQWRERQPMGFSHTPATGRLRWEMLNPSEGDLHHMSIFPHTYHNRKGHHWAYHEDWLVLVPGTLTATQMREMVQALAGKHELKTNGVYAATASETAAGAQQPSLLGQADANHWDDTRVWGRMPVKTTSRPDLLGSPGFLGLAGGKPGSVSKWDDVDDRMNQWADVWHDEAARSGLSEPGDASFRTLQANSTERQFWNDRYFGCHAASGGIGPNDYEYGSYPIYAWLRRNDRGDFAIAWEATTHFATVDILHKLPNLAGWACGQVSDIAAPPGTFHWGGGNAGLEYQQEWECLSLMYLLTGEYLYLEAGIHCLNFYNHWLYGFTRGSGPTFVGHYQTDTGTVNGNAVTFSNPSRWTGTPQGIPTGRPPQTRIAIRPSDTTTFISSSPATVSSFGQFLVITGTTWGALSVSVGTGPVDEGWGASAVPFFLETSGRWVGAEITVGVSVYRVTNLWTATNDQVRVTANGSQSAWSISTNASVGAVTYANKTDVRVQVAGATKTVDTHYTVSGLGTTTATVTFTAGNIPTAGQLVVIQSFQGRRVLISPSPAPAISGQIATITSFPRRTTFAGYVESISGSVAQVSWQFGTPASGTYSFEPMLVHYNSPRAYTWPLAGIIGLARCLGGTVATTYATGGSYDLYRRIHDSSRFMLWWEQSCTHPSMSPSMGGIGTWGTTNGTATFTNHWYGGHGAIHATAHEYPTIPLRNAHQFAESRRALGLGPSFFTAGFGTDIINLLYRWGCHTWMGVDGLSPITSGTPASGGGSDPSGVNALKRLPIGRGGHLASASSYQPFGSPYGWTFTDKPTAIGKTRLDFLYAARNPNQIGDIGFIFFEGPTTTGYGTALMGADILAYVAAHKLHPAGEFAKRDLWLRIAMEMWAACLTMGSDLTFGFGSYFNPTNFGRVRTHLAGNGAANGTVRFPHWVRKHGAEVTRYAQEGFAGGQPPDTQAPTETQALALVSKTDVQIVVDGPAATDNVAVVGYRFFKDGAQDGPDQAGTSHTYSVLTASTTYSLKRRALDAVGNVSGDSNTLSIQTNAAADTTPPTVPEIDTPRTVGQDFITYTWSESIDTQSSLLRYLVRFDGAADEEVLPPTRTITKSGLTPDTTHTCQVRAQDTQLNLSAYGTLVSDTTLAQSTDIDPPSTPGTPTLTASTSTSLTVTFAESTDDVGVVNYLVAATEGVQVDDGTAVADRETTVTAPPALLTGLTRFSDYTVSVVARDAVPNASPASSAVLRTRPLARVFNGSTQLVRATALSTDGSYPITVGIKFYPTAAAAGFLWSLANHTGNNDWLAIKVLANLTVQALRSNATGFSPGATSLGTATLNTWNRVIAVFASDTLCTIRLNTDATAGQDTTLKVAPAGITREAIGGLDRLTPVQYYTGRAAQRALWAAALDAVEQGAFLGGASAWLIRPSAFASFVPLALGADPEADVAGPSAMALVNAPTTADGPDDVLDLTDPVPPGPPQPPTNVVVSALGATTVSITFTPGTDTTGTRVRRLDTSVVFELPVADTTFVDNGLAPFSTYRYTFAGIQSALESAQTAPIEITTRAIHQTPASGRTLRSGVTPKG
jgi:hypothetical protein